MTDSANSCQLLPKDLIERARGIIMDRFDVAAAEGLKVLRRMSQDTGMQMHVVAEQVINYNDPVQALHRIEADAIGFG
jgi:AmiR/NasT family two-component response regulator